MYGFGSQLLTDSIYVVLEVENGGSTLFVNCYSSVGQIANLFINLSRNCAIF